MVECARMLGTALIQRMRAGEVLCRGSKFYQMFWDAVALSTL